MRGWGHMPAKKHHICLNEEERTELERAARSNKRSARERVRARILLLAGKPSGAQEDAAIAAQVGVCLRSVQRVRARFAQGGLVRALEQGVQQKRKARRLDGRAEAHLVALTCGAAPEGHKRWSLHLLAGKLVELQLVDSISHETVRQTLKKTRSSPG